MTAWWKGNLIVREDLTTVTCRSGCGGPVRKGRSFVNKKHQLNWMLRGGAREMNSLLPDEPRVKGGTVAGQQAAASARLVDAAQKGGAASRKIGERVRAKRLSPAGDASNDGPGREPRDDDRRTE